jgi:probable rRNA maturation factor
VKTPKAPLSIAFAVNAEGWPDNLEAVADRAIREAIKQAEPEIVGVTELSVVLTDDAEQRELNQQWRGIDKSTNVLSFPQIEPFAPVSGLLGDVILARETLEREAAEMEITFEAHFTHLVVHGFLHLLGYDHVEDEDAEEMEGLETQILAALGIADPYADS